MLTTFIFRTQSPMAMFLQMLEEFHVTPITKTVFSVGIEGTGAAMSGFDICLHLGCDFSVEVQID